jgi:hypothetical protein
VRRWQKSQVTGESAKETVKTNRAGNAGDTALTCGDFAGVLSFTARQAAGEAYHPGITCALSCQRDLLISQLGRRSRRENVELRRALVPRTQRSTISAFTRVFDTRW